MVVKQFDAKGKELASEEVSSPLYKQILKPDAVKVSLQGDVELYEIVPMK